MGQPAFSRAFGEGRGRTAHVEEALVVRGRELRDDGPRGLDEPRPQPVVARGPRVDALVVSFVADHFCVVGGGGDARAVDDDAKGELGAVLVRHGLERLPQCGPRREVPDADKVVNVLERHGVLGGDVDGAMRGALDPLDKAQDPGMRQ